MNTDRQRFVVGVKQRVVDGDPAILHEGLQDEAVGAEQLVAEVAVVRVQLDLQLFMTLDTSGYRPLEPLSGTT